MSKPYMLALYGSRARGDDDCLSDVDLLYVSDEQDATPVNETDNRLSISRYSWDEFTRMHHNGSLFLLHLKMQSRPISFDQSGYSAYFQLLASLPPYTNTFKDIKAFKLGLSDIRQALEAGDTDTEFELGNLATTIRHAAILGCYLLNEPEFGRYSAVEHFCKATRLPTKISNEFAQLYQFRMAIERQWQAPRRVLPDSYVNNWLGWATDVIEEVALCCEKNKR